VADGDIRFYRVLKVLLVLKVLVLRFSRF